MSARVVVWVDDQVVLVRPSNSQCVKLHLYSFFQIARLESGLENEGVIVQRIRDVVGEGVLLALSLVHFLGSSAA